MDLEGNVVAFRPRWMLNFRNACVAVRHVVVVAVCLGCAHVALGAETYFDVVRSLDHQLTGLESTLGQGTDGNFYGTSPTGGPSGAGAIFRLTPNGALTVLHEFTNGADGSHPYGALLEARDGNFYGTAQSGGTSSCRSVPIGCGTVYRLTPDGAFTIV